MGPGPELTRRFCLQAALLMMADSRSHYIYINNNNLDNYTIIGIYTGIHSQ